MDPAVLSLNQALQGLQAARPAQRQQAAKSFFDALLSNPQHLNAYLHFATDLVRDDDVVIRKELLAFVRQLPGEMLAETAQTMASALLDPDEQVIVGVCEWVEQSTVPIFELLASAALGQLPGGADAANRAAHVFSLCHSLRTQAADRLLQDPNLTHFARVALVKAVTGSIIALSAGPAPEEGSVLASPNVLAAAAQSPLLNPAAITAECSGLWSRLLACLIENSSVQCAKRAVADPSPWTPAVYAEVVGRISSTASRRPHLVSSATNALTAFAQYPPLHMEACCVHSATKRLVLEPSLLPHVRTALRRLGAQEAAQTLAAISPGDCEALMLPEILSDEIATSLPIEQMADFVVANLLLTPEEPPASTGPGDASAAGAASLESLLQSVISPEAAAAATRDVAALTKRVAPRRNPADAPNVSQWASRDGGGLTWRGGAQRLAEGAWARVIQDSALPLVNSVLGGVSGRTLAAVYGSAWSQTLDRVVALAQQGSGAESQGEAASSASTTPLVQQLALLLQSAPASGAAADAPAASATFETRFYPRVCRMMSAACHQLLRSGDADAYQSFLFVCIDTLVALLHRLDAPDLATLTATAQQWLPAFVSECPLLPAAVVARLVASMERTSQSDNANVARAVEVAVITALRDVVALRPAVRAVAVDAILAVALHPDAHANASDNALRVVSKRLMRMDVATAAHVECFARRNLHLLVSNSATAEDGAASSAKRRRVDQEGATDDDAAHLKAGVGADVQLCSVVEQILSGEGTADARVRSKQVRLWCTAAAAKPMLLAELTDAYAHIASSDPNSELLTVIKTSVRAELPSLTEASGGRIGPLLCMLVEGRTALPLTRKLPRAAAPFVTDALEALIDLVLDTLAAAEAASSEAGADVQVVTGSIRAGGCRDVPSVVDLVATAQSVRMEEPSPVPDETNATGDRLDTSETPIALVPLAAVLPAPLFLSTLEQLCKVSSPASIRYFVRRALHTPGCTSPVPADQVVAALITAADSVASRTDCELPDRVRLWQEISAAIFEDRAVLTDRAIVAGMQRVVTTAITRHAAEPTLQPTVPLLLMRCMLVTAQTFPDMRSAVVEQLLLLLRRSGAHMFEPFDILQQWPAIPAATPAHVYEGFVRMLKATVPLSMPLLLELPEPHLKLLLSAKTEAALRERFRQWLSTNAGRVTVPAHVTALMSSLPPPAAAAAPAPAPAPAAGVKRAR